MPNTKATEEISFLQQSLKYHYYKDIFALVTMENLFHFTNTELIIGAYLVIINLATLCLFFIDKRRAIKKRWRIKESTLLMMAILGGSIGALCGMYIFRHKTLHKKFKYGIPLIILLQATALLSQIYR